MTRYVILSIVLLVAAGVSLVWANMRFDHRAHVEDYGLDCVSCHLPGARSIVPDMSVCLDCHDQETLDATHMSGTQTHGPTWALNHRHEAKSGFMDCAACHQQSFCLDCHQAGFADEQGTFGNHMLNVHTSDFHVTHPIAARTNPQLCSSCHEPSFCSDCHTGFRVGRAGGVSHLRTFGFRDASDFHGGAPVGRCDECHTDTVAPSFHEWSLGHAREARRSLQTCQTCHPGGDVCISCHGPGGFKPHGKGWGDRAGRLKGASNGRTCNTCHIQNR